MNRLPFRPFWLLPILALVVLLGVTGFAAAQTPTPDSGPKPDHHRFIPELQDIPRDQLFDHMRGAQFTFTDAQGNAVTYRMTPGTVTGVTSTGVTVMPNGETTAMSFNITPSTMVRGMPAAGSLQAIVEGDKVVVLSRQGSNDAAAIMKHDPQKMHGYMGGM